MHLVCNVDHPPKGQTRFILMDFQLLDRPFGTWAMFMRYPAVNCRAIIKKSLRDCPFSANLNAIALHPPKESIASPLAFAPKCTNLPA